MTKQDKKKETPKPAAAKSQARYTRLGTGDPAPWFVGRETINPQYRFDTAGGRYIVLCFFGSAGDAVVVLAGLPPFSGFIGKFAILRR